MTPFAIQAGHIVNHPSTGYLEWTVLAVDPDAGSARVVSIVLERRQERSFPIGELEIVDSMANQREASQPYFDAGDPWLEDDDPMTDDDQDDQRPLGLRVISEDDGRSLLLQLIELIDFSDACLRQYRREFEPKMPWLQTGTRLRRELRNKGRLIRRNPHEYLRIRTHRFDVSLPRRPTESDRLLIAKLQPRRRQGRPRKAA